MLAVDLAVSVASGTAFLDRFAVTSPGPVLLVSVEDAGGEIPRRLDELYRIRQVPTEMQRVLVVGGQALQFRLDSQDARDKLRSAIVQLQPRVVILDPLVEVGGIVNEGTLKSVEAPGRRQAAQEGREAATFHFAAHF